MNDRKKSEFEATKQALDHHKTVYGIIQAEALNPEDLVAAQIEKAKKAKKAELEEKED